jgi:excisionase family DNA binding protein
MQPLKSVEEAAELLGISPWTVRSYIRDGKLKPVRIGRRVLVEEAELERFVALCQNPVRTQVTTEAAKAGEASL